jgi:hypothetical protein
MLAHGCSRGVAKRGTAVAPHHPPGLAPARTGIVARGSDDTVSLGLAAQRNQYGPVMKTKLEGLTIGQP